jgi:hypothetical protein
MPTTEERAKLLCCEFEQQQREALMVEQKELEEGVEWRELEEGVEWRELEEVCSYSFSTCSIFSNTSGRVFDHFLFRFLYTLPVSSAQSVALVSYQD